MEPSAAKRRKTSPDTAVAVESTTTSAHARRASPNRRSGAKDGDDEIADPFARAGLRRSPAPGLPQLNARKPEMPPTPEVPNPLTSSPFAEIQSSPSRRPRRSRSLAQKLRSSPTKQPSEELEAERTAQQQEDATPEMETEKDSPSVFQQPRPVKRLEKPAKRPKPRSRISDAREIKPPDLSTEMNRAHDALLAEIAQLQAELEIVVRENERIRQLHLSKKDISAPENLDEVVDVLFRHLEPRKSSKPKVSRPSWVQTALDPVAFLPFSKPRSTPPTLFYDDALVLEPMKPPKSHAPKPMKADEDFLYLSAFTPLTFSSHITTLPLSEEETGRKPLLQHHTVTVTSATSPSLFSSRIEMTVDTSTHTITSLSVPSIHPSSAASELAPLLRQIIPKRKGPSVSSALYHNVSILTWAMGSWLRVAIRRAKIWRNLERDLGSVEAVTETVERVRTRKKKGRRTGKGRNDEDDDSNGRVTDSIDGPAMVADLLPYLECMWMDFDIPALAAEEGERASLRIQWRIELDWTGEASSQIRALVSLPSKCKSGPRLPMV